MQVSVCKQQHVCVFVCWACHLRWLLYLPKLLLKGGESQNQVVLSNCVGYTLVLLLFAWDILTRHLTYLQRIYSEGATQCGTGQLQWARHHCLAENPNLHSITCFAILHPQSPLLPCENKLVFRFSNQQEHVILCWQNDWRNPKLFHLFHDPFEWPNNKNNDICRFAFLLPLRFSQDFPQSLAGLLLEIT